MQTRIRGAAGVAIHAAERCNLSAALFPILLVAAAFFSAVESSASEAGIETGEAVLLRLDSLTKKALGLADANGQNKSGKVFDFGKLQEKLPTGGVDVGIIQRGPSGLFDLAIPGLNSITRKMLESSDGGDSLWAAEQFTTGDRPSLVSRMSLEGTQVVDARVMGYGQELGWPLFKTTEIGQCDTLKNAWIFVPEQGGLSLPDQTNGFKLSGKLDICFDQTGYFKSQYPGFDSIPYQRYRAIFKPSRKVLRKKTAAGSLEDADVPQEYEQALDRLEREQYWFFDQVHGPFLLIEKIRPLAGERWNVRFYGAK